VNALGRIARTLRRPWPALITWLMLLFILSTVPLPEGSEGPEVDFPLRLDRIFHGLVYAVLAALAFRALWRPGSRSVLVAAAVLGAVAYGALLEGWQHLIGRKAELGDFIADAVGAMLGGLVAVAGRFGHRPDNRNEQERPDHGLGGRSETD